MTDIDRLREVNRELVEALRYALPIIEADTEASHLLDGFNRKHNSKDDGLLFIKAALKKAGGGEG
jgi:hypothetical protein